MHVKNYRPSGGEFSIVQCNACSMLYTKNPPDEAAIGKYYDMPEYMPHQANLPLIFQMIRWFRNIAKCRATGKKNGMLVDIGCGTGSFLAVAKARGWDVLGVEIDADARKICATSGVSTISPTALHTIPDRSADAVTLWHALEHIHDLRGTLQHCKRILKPNGILIVAVPNISSPEAKMYGTTWAGIEVPIHLYHFTPDSMRRVLEEEGFLLTKICASWTDAIISCILSEQFGRGSFLRGVMRGIRSTLIGWKDPKRAGCPIYKAIIRAKGA
jgi:SAM-dependent methyltransferase